MARLRILPALLASVMLSVMPGSAEGLKLSLSVREQSIVAPNPIRATLYFHNASQQTIWLYRPIGGASMSSSSNPFEVAASEPGPGETSGGSTLTVHVAPTNSQTDNKGERTAHGAVVITGDFPHPRLIRLLPGKDYQERVAIQVEPAQIKSGDGNRFVWGRYQFSVTYSAHYSNENALSHDLGVNLWHGDLSSNRIPLDLQPPTAQGSVEGMVIDSFRRPLTGILATLSNEDEEPLNQVRTDIQGQFSFTHLATGRYWVTVRQPGAAEDTSVFRHFDLSEAAPHATAQLMMLPVEVHESKQLLHKPVFFRVVDGSGHPLANVALAIVWSSGTVIETAKAETDQDGLTVVKLIPGRNFVTLRGHGCRPEDRRADVAAGGGVDGFKFAYDCSRK